MKAETLALIESALDAAGAEGLARAAALEELTRLVAGAVAIEVGALASAARALLAGVDWEWVLSDRLAARREQHAELLAALEAAVAAVGGES